VPTSKTTKKLFSPYYGACFAPITGMVHANHTLFGENSQDKPSKMKHGIGAA
jgi:hypothetical protein